MDPCIVVRFTKKNPTRCNSVSKFYYSIFIWSSTCFGRHNAHHQEPKTALAASGFSYVEGCWTCSWWMLSGTTFHVWKTRGCQWSFRFLMMGGGSLKTCWASYKYGIIKNFDTLLHLVGSFCMILSETLYESVPPLQHTCHAPRPSHDPWLYVYYITFNKEEF